MLIRFVKVALYLSIFGFVISCEKPEDAKTQVPDILTDSLSILSEAQALEDSLTVVGEILPNKGLFQALDSMGIVDSISLQLVNVLRYEVDLTEIRSGEKLVAKFNPDGIHVDELTYQPNSVVKHKMNYNSDSAKYVYQEIREETEVRYRMVTGEIESGSSLNDALLKKEIPSNLTQTVNGILLCKISFRTDAREGDEFNVVLREEYFGEEFIDGKVLYASYKGTRTGYHEAFRYMEEDVKSSYNAHYTKDGEALIHTGLRYPVDRLHISSGYGMRRHPVTGRNTMHRGVDYAAPRGSPVYAVAKGTVIKSSYDNMNGNAVAIRHDDKSVSYYLHLSARSVKKGQTVRTRQLIGRVGSTGRSTGPHLHFGFKNTKGNWMNPLQKRMIATPKLQGEKLARLKDQIAEIQMIIAQLEPGAPAQVMVAQKAVLDEKEKSSL